jgi:hypothetical protein
MVQRCSIVAAILLLIATTSESAGAMSSGGRPSVGGASRGPMSPGGRPFAGGASPRMSGPHLRTSPTARFGHRGRDIRRGGVRGPVIGRPERQQRAAGRASMHPKHSGSAKHSGRAFSRPAQPSARPPRLGSRPAARPHPQGGSTAWRGPVFWPNAYRDIHGYTLWPRAYGRPVWGPAFDDVFAGIFWPPGIAASETVGTARETGGTARETGGAARETVGRADNRAGYRSQEATALSPEFARICDDKAAGLTGRSLERLARTIQPTDAQQAALDRLRSALDKAVEMLRSACPTETPPTVTERFDAMANRLAAMLDAVGLVRPALNRFYNSLTDEQKAHFNRLSAQVDSSQRGKALASNLRADDRSASSRCADESAPGFRDRTIRRIERVVRPTGGQRSALDELRTASVKAAKMLDVRCSGHPPLTPTGRLDAVGQRLAAMSRAVQTMAPAMAKFYALLSDDQKTRLNTMRELTP